MPTGAPTKIPSCHKIFFFLDHGFLPQNVHPEGLKMKVKKNQSINNTSFADKIVIV